jgi:hypothetical protein
MKHCAILQCIYILCLLLLGPLYVQAEANDRSALCSLGIIPGYMNCPNCRGYKADGVTPLKEGVEETLWIRDSKPLNVAEWYVPLLDLESRSKY